MPLPTTVCIDSTVGNDDGKLRRGERRLEGWSPVWGQVSTIYNPTERVPL